MKPTTFGLVILSLLALAMGIYLLWANYAYNECIKVGHNGLYCLMQVLK